MRLRLLLVALLAPLLMGQAGPRLVPDISSRSVEIQYSFTGAQLLLFGAILDIIGVQLLLFGLLAELIISRSPRVVGLDQLVRAESGRGTETG